MDHMREEIFEKILDIDIMILVKMSDEEIRLVKNDIYDLAFEFEINTGIEFSSTLISVYGTAIPINV